MSSAGRSDDNDRLRRGERLPDPEDGAMIAASPADREGWPAPLSPGAYYGVAGRIVAVHTATPNQIPWLF